MSGIIYSRQGLWSDRWPCLGQPIFPLVPCSFCLLPAEHWPSSRVSSTAGSVRGARQFSSAIKGLWRLGTHPLHACRPLCMAGTCAGAPPQNASCLPLSAGERRRRLCRRRLRRRWLRSRSTWRGGRSRPGKHALCPQPRGLAMRERASGQGSSTHGGHHEACPRQFVAPKSFTLRPAVSREVRSVAPLAPV